MPHNAVSRLLTYLGTVTARPQAFLIVLVYAVGWIVIDRDSFDMHGVTTLIVWIMTLTIQRAEHRDTQAIHAKLDELLKAHGDARSELSSIDDTEAEDIEIFRAEQKASL